VSLADPYLFVARQPRVRFQVFAGRRAPLENPYHVAAAIARHGQFEAAGGFVNAAAVNIATLKSVQTISAPEMMKRYPASITTASIAILVGTVVSGLVGYFVPGPLAGAALPIFVTLWWILYRFIRRYDERQTA